MLQLAFFPRYKFYPVGSVLMYSGFVFLLWDEMSSVRTIRNFVLV